MQHRLIAPSHVLRVLEFSPKKMDDPFQLSFRGVKRQMKNILKGSSILLIGFGLSIFFNGHSSCQSQAQPNTFLSESQKEDKSERRWIKKRPPSNQKIKIFIDGQRAATIYPYQWHRDRSGNIYIRTDKSQKWIRDE